MRGQISKIAQSLPIQIARLSDAVLSEPTPLSKVKLKLVSACLLSRSHRRIARAGAWLKARDPSREKSTRHGAGACVPRSSGESSSLAPPPLGEGGYVPSRPNGLSSPYSPRTIFSRFGHVDLSRMWRWSAAMVPRLRKIYPALKQARWR